MKRLLLLVGPFLVVCLCLVGCGGGSSPPPPPPPPQLAGQWEIIATDRIAPPDSPAETHIEVNFNEDSQGNLSASDPILFSLAGPLGYFDMLQLGGYCGLPGPNPVTGSVKTNNNVNFTWTEGAGVQFTASGQLQNDGTVTGSYSGGGTNCIEDSGTFVATRPQNIAGTYFGGYIPTGPSLTLTITAANGNSVTVNGSDSANGNFTLQGTQIGNCVVVSGTIGVLSSTFYGVVTVAVPAQQLAFDDQDQILAILTKQ